MVSVVSYTYPVNRLYYSATGACMFFGSYPNIAAAYQSVSDVTPETLSLVKQTFPEDLVLYRNINTTIKGNLDCPPCTGTESVIHSLTISAGSTAINGLTIK
jgi:hypothetical protein